MIRSLMYWVEMLLHEDMHKEGADENKHLRTWFIVSKENTLELVIFTGIYFSLIVRPLK